MTMLKTYSENYVRPEIRTADLQPEQMLCSSIGGLVEDQAMTFSNKSSDSKTIWQ